VREHRHALLADACQLIKNDLAAVVAFDQEPNVQPAGIERPRQGVAFGPLNVDLHKVDVWVGEEQVIQRDDLDPRDADHVDVASRVAHRVNVQQA